MPCFSFTQSTATTWRQAQSIKHRSGPNRDGCGIAVDWTALLVAIVRRLADEDTQRGAAADDADILFQ
jgi:hypothetical protein